MNCETNVDAQISSLLKKAVEVMKNAYCPYSNFPVGAALLCDDGTVFTGKIIKNR